MESWEQGANGPGNPREIWPWAVLGSLLVHGLAVAVMLAVLQDKPAPRRVVVPVEAIALVPSQPAPAGGGGGRPGPVTRPEPLAPKPTPVPPKPQPRVKPPPPPKVKVAPPPEPVTGPVIPTPAPPPAITKAKPSDIAAAGSRAAPGATAGSGPGGQGGGSGSGSGAGAGPGAGSGSGPGQGSGSGSGSALQGYLREIRRLLEKHKDYPQMARSRNIHGVVTVVFTIGPGGQIMAARVGRSSGQDLLDEAAQNTIRRVGKFPPLPAELNRQQLTIEVPLAFRLHHD